MVTGSHQVKSACCRGNLEGKKWIKTPSLAQLKFGVEGLHEQRSQQRNLTLLSTWLLLAVYTKYGY